MKISTFIQEEEIIQRLKLEPDAPVTDLGTYPAQLRDSTELPRPAAVLVPLVKIPTQENGNDWHILYTRRTDLVQDHKGQVSFPGGRSDPGDISPEVTALREAFEEIGLQPSDVKILGRLPQFITITNYLVTPVVGTFSWPYHFVLQPNEVSRVFTIPISWMADPSHYQIRDRQLPIDFPVPPQFRTIRVIYFEPYDDEILWGATADVTLRLIRRLGLENITGAAE